MSTAKVSINLHTSTYTLSYQAFLQHTKIHKHWFVGNVSLFANYTEEVHWTYLFSSYSEM